MSGDEDQPAPLGGLNDAFNQAAQRRTAVAGAPAYGLDLASGLFNAGAANTAHYVFFGAQDDPVELVRDRARNARARAEQARAAAEHASAVADSFEAALQKLSVG